MSRPGSARHLVDYIKVDEICCHRVIEGNTEYLIRWKHDNSAEAVVSWHQLDELTSINDSLQVYISEFVKSLKSRDSTPNSNGLPRKRKRLHDEDLSSRASSQTSQTPSFTAAASPDTPNEPRVWNGIIQRKSGDIYPVHLKGKNIPRIDATTLPTQKMLAAALSYGFEAIRQARNLMKNRFETKFPAGITFKNERDKESPAEFTMISDYVYGAGVHKADDTFITGCSKCRPDMGGNKGCEYTKKCECLEDAAPDPTRIKDQDMQQYKDWLSGVGSAEGLPKRFPYSMRGGEYVLDSFYLDSRNVIYECNQKCRCGPNCKNKKVQKGRTVPLEIFKTKKRGFGLRCPRDLRRGEYIDRYLGEIITDAEAEKRELASGPNKASYLFNLDKFANNDDPAVPSKDECYVVDGEHMGGPTRFINHSCDPNCRLFSVSYNKNDYMVYDLAFFALYDIRAGEELTFDYLDPDDGGEAGQASMEGVEDGKDAPDCHCGAKNCRGKLWR